MKERKIRLVLIMLLISMFSVYAILLQFSGKAEEVEIGLGVEFNTHATPMWVAIHTGLMEKHGIKTKSLLKFRTGADLASAIARGEVDLGIACLGPIVNLLDRDVDVKIVGKVHNLGYSLIVNPERVKNIKDLENTVVYSTGIPNPTNILLLKIKYFYGLNFEIKPVGDPNTLLSMLISGQINSAVLPEHYSTVAEENGLKVLLREREVWPNMPGSYIIARGELLNNEPEVVKRFVKMVEESITTFRENKSLALHACSLELGVSDYIASKSLENLEWDTEINTTEIQEYIDFMYAHGLIDKRIDAREIVMVDWK